MEVDEENLDKKNNREVKPKFVARTLSEMQRVKLDKLMKNPQKNVIPESVVQEKDFMNTIPSFVRNVMGSSAGAGSGEFHVYRHLRRKEYARQKFIQHSNLKEKLDGEFHDKIEQNKLLADSKTAKKRLKRQKLKAKLKGKPKKTKSDVVEKPESSSSSSSESEDEKDDDSDNKEVINDESSLINKDIENNDLQTADEKCNKEERELNTESINRTEVENDEEEGDVQTAEQKPVEVNQVESSSKESELICSSDVIVSEDNQNELQTDSVLNKSTDKLEEDVVGVATVNEQ